MNAALSEPATAPAAQDRLITATVERERGRLLAFIRRRIADAAEAEDVLQETLYEFVAAQRLMQPIEQAGAWLLRVARNRIIDRLRRRAPFSADDAETSGEAGAESLADLLPSGEAGPEAQVMRAALVEEIEAALAELPEEQRAVFVAQELEGVTFRELAARSGVSINTLIARKRYALLHLRARLQAAWDEWLLW
jgi:RNA polymerase sigma factor (sigma-70 family)